MVQGQTQYEVGETVSILTPKYFGYQAVIEKVQAKNCQVRLIKPAITSDQKI